MSEQSSQSRYVPLNANSMAKKILKFFGSFLAVVGGLGSFGYEIYLKEWFIAIGEAVVCFAAFPTVKGWVKDLMA